MSCYFDTISKFIPLYPFGRAIGSLAVIFAALGFAAFAFGQTCTAPCDGPDSCCNGSASCCYGQVNPTALAAPPCGVYSYARIWLRPGCVPPSFCKFRCNDSTHIWDGYSNQQSEKLNRQLARQLYHLQKQHIARGWPWYGGFHGQQPCPGFGPATIGVGAACGATPGNAVIGDAMAGGAVSDGMPCEGEMQGEIVSDEAVDGSSVKKTESSTLRLMPEASTPQRISPLPPISASK